MLYLLDSNVLIDANRDYYPLERVPEFWDWLLHIASLTAVKIPTEIYEELKDGNDALKEWVVDYHEDIVLYENVSEDSVSNVLNEGYANDLNDEEIETIGMDPFLIAYATADIENRCVVTTEASKPKKKRANRHMPDVCGDLNVRCCDTFGFLREMDFRTNWRT